MAGKDPQTEKLVQGRCPICSSPTETAYRPFCSQRCRDIDLSRWLGGGYAIPGGRAEADEDGEDVAAQFSVRDGAASDNEEKGD